MTQIRFSFDTAQRHQIILRNFAEDHRAQALTILNATADPPSYSDEFRRGIQAIRREAYERFLKISKKLETHADELQSVIEAFELADLISQSGLSELNRDLEAWLKGLVPEALWHAITRGISIENFERLLKLYVAGVGDVWQWYIEDFGNILRNLPREVVEVWFNTIDTLFNIWINYPIWGPALVENILGMVPQFQTPGLDPNGPITSYLAQIAQLDDSDEPVSLVGAELVQLIDERGGVVVMFADELTNGGNAGVAPFSGLVWLPESYENVIPPIDLDNVTLVAHELAHILQRDLEVFPDGYTPSGMWPYTPEGFQPGDMTFGAPAGDFTLYMEVQSNIVENVIMYDLAQADLARYPERTDEWDDATIRMETAANNLATFTGHAGDACMYVVERSRMHGMYVGELTRELISGQRIPEGGWQYWLSEQGFSDQAIQHIETIAASGAPQPVMNSGLLDDPNIPPSTPAPETTARPE